MTYRITSRAGGVGVGCAAALLSITTAVGCSDGDGGKSHPKQAESAPSAVAGSAGPGSAGPGSAGPGSAGPGSAGANEKAPTWGPDNLPPGVDYWAGKADLTVFLCQVSDPRTGGCSDGAATPARREEILAALEAMPQVEQVYFENRQQAWELFRAQNPNSPLADVITADQLPESFRVKLKDPTTVTAVTSALAGRPGIVSTKPHTPETHASVR
ncbi:permease-like cell division protein FtsX (plasmid) [Embleya sp. NBC_00888]|uniref:permease-like cell division protein FtsX n=1 Tax=Embleya sp. NBC_00888 TaxID=2975960 RepID=UPI002F911B1C|nr:permease-like cell division protein FtsX [Embleya sp. NBC_00888]